MANNIMNLIATSSSRIRELPIKNGQLIFIQDLGRIAFDFKGKRVFYNQIVELETEADRTKLENPLDGYYFVIGTGVLWFYKDGWTQLTDKPQNILFIGVELPQLGHENQLYVNITDGYEHISVWSEERNEYIIVADKTHEVTEQDILNLFN
jgi:hypothetical protein